MGDEADLLRPFRTVERFIDGFLSAQSLCSGFELGVIQHVRDHAGVSVDDLAAALSLDRTHLRILIGLLRQFRVLTEVESRLEITPEFRQALDYRDLLEARLDYSMRVRKAMIDFYSASIRNPEKFHSRIVDCYQFDTRQEYSAASGETTEKWVRHMSTMSRYFMPILLEQHDFSHVRRLLDVGGNIGEVATHICHRYSELEVTIVDIPVVCDLGAKHVARAGLQDRIKFVKGDARRDVLPDGFDTVLFSSMLHDHVPEVISALLSRARAALKPKGEIVIWETLAVDFERESFAEFQIDIFPFLAYFGPVDRYSQELARLGFRDVQTKEVEGIRFLKTSGRL